MHAQEELVDEDEKTYDSEKIAFPSTDSPIPTFSVSFGSGPDVPPPSQMKFGATRGPRFYSGSSGASNPFETPFETPPGSVRGEAPRRVAPQRTMGMGITVWAPYRYAARRCRARRAIVAK